VAIGILLDTSVLTRLATSVVRSAVTDLAVEADRIARASMSDLEIGFSARNAAEFDALVGALGAFEPIEIVPEHFRRARQVQRLLADRGLRGRKVPDLLIAAAAESNDLTVVHYDADFDHIAGITNQATAWVVPPGTID
jgi:predicted nucleic acid-binding protein